MTSDYRQYKNFVPNYLHNRPRSVIRHCLERKTNGQKYAQEDISCTDDSNGTFHVKGTNKTHAIDFGKSSSSPSCTCKDWIKWNIPCKHFFAIFKFYPKWNWYALPSSYLNSEYLSSDSATLTASRMTSNSAYLNEETNHVADQQMDSDETFDDIPRKKVMHTYCMCIHVYEKCLYLNSVNRERLIWMT